MGRADCKGAQGGDAEATVRAGWRPEVLVQALGDLPDDGGAWPPADRLDDAFEAAVLAAVAESDEAMLKVVRALTPLQGAVLRVMAAQGEAYTPYGAASLAACAAQLAALDPGSTVRVDVPNVQSALEALQAKSLAWRAGRVERTQPVDAVAQ